MPEVSRKSSKTREEKPRKNGTGSGVRSPRRRAGPARRIIDERIATSRASGALIVVSRTRERDERASQSFEPFRVASRVPERASSGLPRQTPGLSAGRLRIPAGSCDGSAVRRVYRLAGSVNVPPRAASSSINGAGPCRRAAQRGPQLRPQLKQPSCATTPRRPAPDAAALHQAHSVPGGRLRDCRPGPSSRAAPPPPQPARQPMSPADL